MHSRQGRHARSIVAWTTNLCLRRLHAHGLIAKIPGTRRWRVTDYWRKGMGTTMCLREHHFPNANAGVMH